MRYNRKCKMAYLLGFNNNIRCIEINNFNHKYGCPIMFNNNIRCIEIGYVFYYDYVDPKFNNNIRCIEIKTFFMPVYPFYSLITT